MPERPIIMQNWTILGVLKSKLDYMKSHAHAELGLLLCDSWNQTNIKVFRILLHRQDI